MTRIVVFLSGWKAAQVKRNRQAFFVITTNELAQIGHAQGFFVTKDRIMKSS
jgi:hypothetical protein